MNTTLAPSVQCKNPWPIIDRIRLINRKMWINVNFFHLRVNVPVRETDAIYLQLKKKWDHMIKIIGGLLIPTSRK